MATIRSPGPVSPRSRMKRRSGLHPVRTALLLAVGAAATGERVRVGRVAAQQLSDQEPRRRRRRR
jgi:hypothetical protein